MLLMFKNPIGDVFDTFALALGGSSRAEPEKVLREV